MAESNWGTAIKIILVLVVLSFIAAAFLSVSIGEDNADGNIAIIPIKGVISTGGSGLFDQQVASSAEIVSLIEKASKNPEIKAIILEINSPGGAPVATEEIANAIESTDKMTVAWIREIGTSAGYWVASSADKVVASRMSTTGSIGAIMSYLDFSGLLDDYNVTYQRLVAGQYKDIGSPFRHLTINEQQIMQKYLDRMHEYFIKAVAINRNMTVEQVREVATGMFFLGEEAKELGLVDELGEKAEAVKIIENQLNITAVTVQYSHEPTLGEILGDVFSKQSFYVGKGIGSSLLDAGSSKIRI